MDERKHKMKQNKAISKAIKELMDEVIHSLLVSGIELNKPLPSNKKLFKNNRFYHYFLIGTKLSIFIDYIPSLPEGLCFTFPDANEIIEKAKEKYEDLDCSIIDGVEYNFEFKDIFVNIEITAENSELRFKNLDIDSRIDIISAREVNFRRCNLRRAQSVYIHSSNIDLNDCRIGDSKIDGLDTKVFLDGVDVNINKVVMDSTNDIEISSSLLCIKDSNMRVQNILLDSDMIESVNSRIIANDTINIYDKYNDDIKGVVAPHVFYNKVDISNSDGLHIHKEKDKLLEVLKKAKTLLEEIIEKDKTEIIKNYEERANNTLVKEIINRQNI